MSLNDPGTLDSEANFINSSGASLNPIRNQDVVFWLAPPHINYRWLPGENTLVSC